MAERPRTLSNPDALVVEQTRAVENFLGREEMPRPPQALLEFVERTAEQGFSFELYFEPRVTFNQDSSYPGLIVKPNPWFFEQIQKGNISPDAASLSGQWAAMEGFPKPEYDGGEQLYKNDPLAPKLEMLRKKGKIAVTDWCRDIPSISRFGTSPDEIDSLIVPVFAELSQIEDQIKSGELKAETAPWAAWFYRGNTEHPEWGQTNTWEWLADNFEAGYRLIGGRRGRGGLANVHCGWRGDHRGNVGFRLRVVSSS